MDLFKFQKTELEIKSNTKHAFPKRTLFKMLTGCRSTRYSLDKMFRKSKHILKLGEVPRKLEI